jgi:hypothetical protein
MAKPIPWASTTAGAPGSITTAVDHGFLSGECVRYTGGGGTDVGGLTDGTSYYVRRESKTTFKLATSKQLYEAKSYLTLSEGGTTAARFIWADVNRADFALPRLIVGGAVPGRGTTYGDVMVAHPHADVYTRVGPTRPDHCVCQAERHKDTTYHAAPDEVRAGATITPMVVSSLGRLGPRFVKFLRSAAGEVIRLKGPGVSHLDAHAPRGGDARFPTGRLLSRWMILISCTLQRANARAWLSAHGPATLKRLAGALD